jgi:hypothetical protein
MELLRQHGLYGGGLIDIDSPLLAGRYNKCLAEIGENPTALARFQIDGRGWSPEVAAEKQNPAYLSHGGAVQYAILLTPDQIGKPVHRAYFSFERALLAFLFKQAGDAIARITKTTGLYVQIDPGISKIEHVGDLAMIRSATVTLGDPEHLVQAAEDQRKLVARFQNETDAWTDKALRTELSASGQKFGDLRFAPTFNTSYQYSDLACFYTPEFGGAFVFRGSPGKKDLLVLGDESLTSQGEAGCWVSSLQNKTLLSRLISMGLLEIPIEWYRENLKVFEKLREGLLVAVLYKNGENSINFAQLNQAQRERCAMDYRNELPPEFSALERLEQRLSHGETVDVQRLSLPLKWLLARPANLPIYVANLLQKLICRVTNPTVTTQFAYDKEAFFEAFGSWPEARKRWAMETILQTGLTPRRHA